LKEFRQFRVRKNLEKRAWIICAIRRFFIENNYLEVETPLRIPAPAPETHIDAAPSGNWFLHASPELCLKRLLAAGYPRIFEICKCFRQNERGSRHLPEFTMLEWYAADTGYLDMMDTCENLILFAARSVGVEGMLTWQGRSIALGKPWQRLSVEDAFEKYASIPLVRALENDLFDQTLALEIEPFLGVSKPVFLYDYPAQKAAFARLKPDDPRYAERFELYIGGMEICNAFSELTDPAGQRSRFEQEQFQRRQMGKDIYPMPERFLSALPQMPAASGNALGIDRLVMLFADANTIDDVTAFVPEEL
jgi:elongation factor P--(R)-beta-lysine ligase